MTVTVTAPTSVIEETIGDAVVAERLLMVAVKDPEKVAVGEPVEPKIVTEPVLAAKAVCSSDSIAAEFKFWPLRKEMIDFSDPLAGLMSISMHVV